MSLSCKYLTDYITTIITKSHPQMLHASHTELHGSASELSLSRCAAGILLVVYGAFLYFQMARAEVIFCATNDWVVIVGVGVGWL